jgi:hypothetical protein
MMRLMDGKLSFSLGPFLLVFHGVSAMEEEKAICVASRGGSLLRCVRFEI